MLLKSDLCSAESEQQPKSIPPDDSPSRDNSISLSFILTSGPGIVSEIVARWAVHHRISPELLTCSPSVDATLLNEDISVNNCNDSSELKR